jgi:teichuronic acid biosynthesis glycosyltransferase TuaG
LTSAVPRVSIITPAYNAAAHIGETIASVQAQTFEDWEMLIADDASSDDTCAVVAGFAAQDSRLTLIRQAENGGPAVARNAALAEARGRYICFLDSDDLWLPEKLERQLAFMAETGAAVGYTAFRRLSQDGRRVGKVIGVPASLTHEQLLKNTAIATLTVMIDREKTGPFRLTDAGYDDYILWLELLGRGFTARGLQQDLARYRTVGGSVSSRPRRSIKWVWHIYRDIENLGPVMSLWCLAHYGVRAAIKRLRF